MDLLLFWFRLILITSDELASQPVEEVINVEERLGALLSFKGLLRSRVDLGQAIGLLLLCFYVLLQALHHFDGIHLLLEE